MAQSPEKMEEVVPVVFRKYPDGEIIALFPTIPGDRYGHYCLSYMHVGQHGSADYEGVVRSTESARPDEYKGLASELRSIGYQIRPVQRSTSEMRDERIREARSHS